MVSALEGVKAMKLAVTSSDGKLRFVNVAVFSPGQ
jgi:hypothetical protein